MKTVETERDLFSVIARMEDDLQKASAFAKACEELVEHRNLFAFYELNSSLQDSLERLRTTWDMAFELAKTVRTGEAA